MDITLTNKGLDAVLRSRMDENEEKRYDIYNTTYGIGTISLIRIPFQWVEEMAVLDMKFHRRL